jgi:phosphatidate cytidylyltransferase
LDWKFKLLLKRIITALILVPLVIGLIFLPNSYFAIVTALIMGMAAWEWSKLIGLKTKSRRAFYLLFFWSIFYPSYFLPPLTILWLALCWWLFAFYLILKYPKVESEFSQGWLIRGLSGWLVLLPFWIAINLLHKSSHSSLLMVLCLVWAIDIGSFFAGKLFGRHKLAPQISPNKTIEGACGGMILALITAIAFSYFSSNDLMHWQKWIIIIITACFSIVGDLLESILKRIAQVKDSGSLLPGHGGILDRIDSLTAAVPIFTFCWLLFF